MVRDEFLSLVESEKYVSALNLLEKLTESSSDYELEEFVNSLYDKESEYRELSVSYDEGSYQHLVRYKDEVVGAIDNHIHEMSFRSYESPLGKLFPYSTQAPKRNYDQYPDDDVSVAEFECFDRYVRSGEPFRRKEGTYLDFYSGMNNYIQDCRRILHNLIKFDGYEPKG